MKATVIWFTYRDDKDLLVESVKSVARTFKDELAKGEVEMRVVDDGFCAIPLDFVKENILSLGAQYIKSYYPRSGNLLGQENLLGQLKEMANADGEIIVKIDSDTVLLRKDWLEDFAEKKNALIAASYKNDVNYPMGNCYAVRAEILPRLVLDVEKYPAWRNCFEDYEVGVRLNRLANGDLDRAVRYRSGVEDGFWLCDPHQVNDYARQARVVSCGFTLRGIPADRRADYKKKQVEVMKKLNGGNEHERTTN